MDIIEICKTLRNTIDRLEILLAVETLEFHNKNWLAGNEAKRSKDYQIELKNAIADITGIISEIGSNCQGC